MPLNEIRSFCSDELQICLDSMILWFSIFVQGAHSETWGTIFLRGARSEIRGAHLCPPRGWSGIQKVSWLLGFWFLGFKDSWFLGCRVSWFLGFKDSKILQRYLKIFGPYYQFSISYFDRYWSHIQDFQDFIKRIVQIFGARLFEHGQTFGVPNFKIYRNTIFKKCVGICLDAL